MDPKPEIEKAEVPPLQQASPPTPQTSSVSKHLILILLVLFPPLAWYYMWKENKYHNWFASVLMIDGLIFIGTSILLMAAVYPPITQLYDSLALPHPVLAETLPYVFIIIGVIEILYGLYLKTQTRNTKSLSKSLLVVAVFLLLVHFIGLPLGQGFSYFSTISTLYNTNLNPSSRIAERNALTITPTPSWKTYTNTKLNISLSYPADWTYDEYEGNSGLVLKPKNDKKYKEKYNGVLQIRPGGFGSEKVTSFENWIRTKGNQEIQGLGTINTLTPVTTNNGATGYRVVWNMLPGTPSSNKTLTIYYFQLPNSTTSSGIELTLNDAAYETQTEQIISTFKFTDAKVLGGKIEKSTAKKILNTKNWKLYKNEDFTMKYPPDWTVNGIDYVSFKPKSEKEVETVIGIAGGQADFPGSGDPTETITLDSINIDGINAGLATIIYDDPSLASAQIQDDTMLLLPSATYSFNLQNIKYRDIYHAMLTSIKVKNKNTFNYQYPFSPTKIRIGEKLGELTIASIKPYNTKYTLSPVNATISFTGQITISGQYYFYDANPSGRICFLELDKESEEKLPIIKGTGRSLWVCLTNREYAAKLLNPEGEAKAIKIVLDNYTINNTQSEVANTARLVKVIR